MAAVLPAQPEPMMTTLRMRKNQGSTGRASKRAAVRSFGLSANSLELSRRAAAPLPARPPLSAKPVFLQSAISWLNEELVPRDTRAATHRPRPVGGRLRLVPGDRSRIAKFGAECLLRDPML